MKISFITTVYNEESAIEDLLLSLSIQSKIPDEIIIVDAGSDDRTVKKIKAYDRRFKIIIKKGNRAVGRNEAIKKSSNEIIVCSDAGCVLDKDWVKNITKPFENENIDAVAGYYKGDFIGIFQKCLVTYVLVMPDNVDKNNFLPAGRSMAFRKSVWEKAGGFPEEFNNNEDYVFAKKLKKIKSNIVFKKNAIVYWRPRDNIKDAFIMFYRFAKGDAHANIFRPKVILLFVRYIIGFGVLLSVFILKSDMILNLLYFILSVYIFWVITKNYRYVIDFRAVFFLPLIQFVSDIAIIMGTTVGLLIKMREY